MPLPYTTRRRLYRRKPTSMLRRRPYVRRLRVPRMRFNPKPVFTETADLGSALVPIAGSTPGVFTGQLQVSLGSIPQILYYQNLYNCARILKVKYHLVPSFTQYAPQPSVTSGTQSQSAPRLVYAIQDTAAAQPPVNELDVLSENGSKIRLFTRPITIAHRPVPGLSEGITTGGFAAVSKKYQWITLNTSGLGVPHGSVNYVVSQDNPNLTNSQIQWNIYAKITFQLSDPK